MDLVWLPFPSFFDGFFEKRKIKGKGHQKGDEIMREGNLRWGEPICR